MRNTIVAVCVTLLVLLVEPATAQTMTPLARISHDATVGPTYSLSYGNGLTQALDLELFTATQGSDNGSSTWDFEHMSDGSGWAGGNFMRYYRWAGVDGDPQSGFFWSLDSTSPPGGWTAIRTEPLYFRWRMRVMSHMGESVGHGAMKWLIFGGPGLADGNSRLIVFIYSGSYTGSQLGRNVSDANYTGLALNAGVSGSRAFGLVPNGRWVNVQAAVRWGPTGTAYQRLYIDNNEIAQPDFENTSFSDLSGQTWTFPDLGGGNAGTAQWGNIVTTNSESSTDFVVDWMDFEIDDEFDPNWHLGPSSPTALQVID